MSRYFAIFTLLIMCACTVPDRGKELKELDYNISSTQSRSLFIKAKLRGLADPQKLTLQCDLENLADKGLTIKEVIVTTSDGLRSLPKNFAQLPINIPSKAKVKLSFDFHPINDLKLYHHTEMNGALKSKYVIEVVYKLDGSNQLMAMDLAAALPLTKFYAYQKTYAMPVKAYYLNTSNNFSENLRDYFEQQKLDDTKVFIHLSDQEIAVAGLNFRLKTYKISDSLITKIAVINHSQFPIKVDTSKLEFFFDNQPRAKGYKKIALQKITGSKDEYNILRKGDRMIINLSRFNVPPQSDKITLSLKHLFVSPTGKSLFCDDMEMVEVRDESFKSL